MSKPLLRPCKRIKELRVLSYPSCSASETVAVPQDLWGAFSETGGHCRCVIEQDRALRGRRPRSLSRWGEGFALPPGLRARRARGRALPWLLHPAGPGCGRQGAASGCRDPAGPSGGGGGAGPGRERRPGGDGERHPRPCGAQCCSPQVFLKHAFYLACTSLVSPLAQAGLPRL